jgi:hypothetical protein
MYAARGLTSEEEEGEEPRVARAVDRDREGEGLVRPELVQGHGALLRPPPKGPGREAGLDDGRRDRSQYLGTVDIPTSRLHHSLLEMV